MIRRILRKMKPKIQSIYLRLSTPPAPNLLGDRDIEHSWIAANIPNGPGKALDFGTGSAHMGLIAARKGYEVLSIDLLPVKWYYTHPELQFKNFDLFQLDFPDQSLDLIINCSSIEHVGLKGRYGVKENQPEGDIEAMKIMKRLLKPGKIMLLTIPLGIDKVYYPDHRIYGSQRFSKLLDGWEIINEEFWVKDDENRWCQTKKDIILNLQTKPHYFGLGLFVLKPNNN